MNVPKKLQEWRTAGVIDAQTLERIELFEQNNPRPMLLYALGGLGASTIGLGILSLIAAN